VAGAGVIGSGSQARWAGSAMRMSSRFLFATWSCLQTLHPPQYSPHCRLRRKFSIISHRPQRPHLDPPYCCECTDESNLPSTICSPHILLIIHNKEMAKWSNTGKLLLETIPRAQRSLLVWSGRNDAELVDRTISELRAANFTPVLVWPDEGADSTPALGVASDAHSYIILDGTWQQAQDMFRKGPPSIRAIPRLSLSPSLVSSYRLRRDFGYQARFSAGRRLLCTAEAAAELLALAGAPDLAESVRAALARFQARFPARPVRPTLPSAAQQDLGHE
jgi:DTW domain-containing protein YfiP